MTSADPSPAERLGDAVAQRLRYLSLSHRDAAVKSKDHDPDGRGISTRTITGVVSGDREAVHPRTAGILERTLRWPEGTVQHILEGGDPPDVELTDPDVRFRVQELEVEVRRLRRMVAAMLDPDEDGSSGVGGG